MSDLDLDLPAVRAGASALAGVAGRLGALLPGLRALTLTADAFGKLPESEQAHRRWDQASKTLIEYLTVATNSIEGLSERVHRAGGDHERADERRAAELDRLSLLGLSHSAGVDLLVSDGVGIPSAGSNPHAVHDWWSGLSPEQRGYVLQQHPGTVGPLDGVPAADRDAANRITLVEQRAELVTERQNNLNDVVYVKELDQRIATLDHLATAAPENGQAYLLKLSTEDDGRAIVAVGNPDLAGRVITHIPGMSTDLTSMPHLVGQMDQLVGTLPEGTAAIAYLDYNPPNGVHTVWQEGPADAGAAGLSRFQDGLNATGTAGTEHLLVPHSYGGVLYGHAAATYGVDTDAVYGIGWIGTGQSSAHEFLGTSSVSVSLHPPDIAQVVPAVPYLNHGVSPLSESFGADVIPVQSATSWPHVAHYSDQYFRNPEVLNQIREILEPPRDE